MDETDQRVLNDIAKYGWHLVSILADDQGPSFVFSVGMMQTLGHPEIIMFGLDDKLMASVINHMGKDIRAGRNFAELGLFEGLLEGYACRVVRVDPRWHSKYLGYAQWHRRHVGKINTLEALQCLWPDRAGLFPGEPGFHPPNLKLQPLLG